MNKSRTTGIPVISITQLTLLALFQQNLFRLFSSTNMANFTTIIPVAFLFFFFTSGLAASDEISPTDPKSPNEYQHSLGSVEPSKLEIPHAFPNGQVQFPQNHIGPIFLETHDDKDAESVNCVRIGNDCKIGEQCCNGRMCPHPPFAATCADMTISRTN